MTPGPPGAPPLCTPTAAPSAVAAARRVAVRQRGAAPPLSAGSAAHRRPDVTSRTSRPLPSPPPKAVGGGLHAQTGAVGRGFSRGLGRGGRKQRKHAAHHSRRGARRRLRNRQVRLGGKRTTEGELRASAPLHRGRGSLSRGKLLPRRFDFKEKINILFGFCLFARNPGSAGSSGRFSASFPACRFFLF